MPKYLMLIVESEAEYASGDEAVFNDVMQQHASFSAEVEQAGGKILGGEALQPTSTATYLRGTRTATSPSSTTRRPTSRRSSAATTSSRPTTTTTPGGSPSAARRRSATSRCARSGTSPAWVADDGVAAAAADAQRRYWGRVLAATLRMARDLDIAEEATADAFALALQTWPDRGVPDSVEAWLLTAARRRAIDRIRRLARFRERLAAIAATGDLAAQPADAGLDAPPVLDDELRLVVLCCHPALRPGGPGRPDHAPRVWRADGVGCCRLPRPRGDDGGAADSGEEAHRRFGHRNRPARRPRRGGAHAGSAPHDPPRLRDGSHRWLGSGTPPRRCRRPCRPARQNPARLATRRQRGDRPAGAAPADRGTRRDAHPGGRRPGAARRRRPHAVGSDADRRRARARRLAVRPPVRSACRR